MKLLGTPLVLALLCVAQCSAERWWKSWSYNCTKSVFDWPVDYPYCDSARKQLSPINLVSQPSDEQNFRPPVEAGEVESHFHAGAFRAEVGLLLELTVSTAETMPQTFKVKWSEDAVRDFQLKRIVFHHPSEHTVNGQRFPLEVQLFLKDGQNKDLAVAVLGIVTESELVTPVVKDLAAALDANFADASLLIDNFNPAALLPTLAGFFTYNGSDTAPPCTQDTQWIIMEHAVNFTQSMVSAVNRQITRFHPQGQGNARPLMPQSKLEVVYHGSQSELLKAAGVAMTNTQSRLFLSKKLMHPSILTAPPMFMYAEPYHLNLPSQCRAPASKERQFEVEPNTHPDVLALNPDVTVQTQMRGTSVPPDVETVRKPLPAPVAKLNTAVPRKMFATWTNQVAANARAAEILKDCATQNPKSAMCKAMLSQLPPDVEVRVSVPLPPLPAKPEPRFIPNNWPLEPATMNAPAEPESINPYNPWTDRILSQKEAANPLSGSLPYMHKPSEAPTPFLKPVLGYPAVYPELDANSFDRVMSTK